MRRNKPTANPSRIATLVDYYNKGLLTKDELLRLKREALKTNVYTGKERTNEETRNIQNTRVLKFGSNN